MSWTESDCAKFLLTISPFQNFSSHVNHVTNINCYFANSTHQSPYLSRYSQLLLILTSYCKIVSHSFSPRQHLFLTIVDLSVSMSWFDNFWLLRMIWLTLGRLTHCQSSVVWVLAKYQKGCWSSADWDDNWGYW